MSPSTLERRSLDWLDDHSRDWVARGLITGEQADAIRHLEHLDEPEVPQRLTVVAEVASYLGSVIAFAGGAAIVGPNWERIGLVGQLAIGVAIAAIGFVAGSWLVHQAEAGTVRLGCFLWAVGAGGIALAAGAVVNQIDPRDEGWFGVAIGLPVLAIGIGLWRNLDRPLQLLTAVVGLFIVYAGISGLVDVSVWIASPMIWGASLVFGVLAALGHVKPRTMALITAAAGLMVGSLTLADESDRLAAIVAVATAAGIVAYALVDRSWPLVGVGLFAFFVAITNMMQTVLQGMAARLVAVLLGLVVVGGVAVRAQRAGRPGPQPNGP
jgi:hypothetical protein